MWRSFSLRRIFVLVLAALGAGALWFGGARVGTAALAAQAPSRGGVIRPVPDELQDTSWLQAAMAAQLRAAADWQVFHDFQFTDRKAESGISFYHHMVDDAGKAYKAVHYDHGNGLAIADVDGDGR